MSADEVAAFLFGLRARGVRPGLAPTRAALDAAGAPDRAFPIVQIAGSVGKGSTAAGCAGILGALGLKVGLFTSPHLVRFTERFRIGGREVSAEAVAGTLRRLRRAMPWAAGEGGMPPGLRPLTFFEWSTLLSCALFRDEAVDVAILEVGLGGRWDATTACRADFTVITRLDLEHTAILGETLVAIAAEKAGVMRPGIPAFTVDQDPEALAVLRARAAEVGAPLSVVGPESGFHDRGDGTFDWDGPGIPVTGLRPAPLGAHQVENAALATAAAALAARAVRPKPAAGELVSAVREGLASAAPEGRFETLAPGLVLDGAHTPRALAALAQTVAATIPGGRAHVVFAALRDKPVGVLLEALRPAVASLTLTRAGGDRAAEPGAAAEAAAGWDVPVHVVPDPAEAVARARAAGGTVVVCGSFYLVGAVRAALEGARVAPGDPAATEPPIREAAGA